VLRGLSLPMLAELAADVFSPSSPPDEQASLPPE
jgi:hypothetical protein